MLFLVRVCNAYVFILAINADVNVFWGNIPNIRIEASALLYRSTFDTNAGESNCISIRRQCLFKQIIHHHGEQLFFGQAESFGLLGNQAVL